MSVCNAYLDLDQESDRFPAIKQAVIVRKCEVHHLKTISIHHLEGLLFYLQV